MLNYFWSDSSAIPADHFTANFSPGHIAWVLAVLLLIPVVVLAYRRRPAPSRARFKKALVIALVLCEVSSWLWQALIGSFRAEYSLPLQLCDISVFVEFLAVFLNTARPGRTDKPARGTLLTEFSYALSMPAALAALVTPGWYYPFLTYGYLKMAVMHAILILIPALLVWGDGYRPDARRLPKVSLLFVLFIAAAVTVNIFLKSNYMFLSYVPPDTLLVAFQSWFGNPGYEIPELILLLLIWAALYLPWNVTSRRQRMDSKPGA